MSGCLMSGQTAANSNLWWVILQCNSVASGSLTPSTGVCSFAAGRAPCCEGGRWQAAPTALCRQEHLQAGGRYRRLLGPSQGTPGAPGPQQPLLHNAQRPRAAAALGLQMPSCPYFSTAPDVLDHHQPWIIIANKPGFWILLSHIAVWHVRFSRV